MANTSARIYDSICYQKPRQIMMNLYAGGEFKVKQMKQELKHSTHSVRNKHIFFS
jgi:hypothetical protein